MKANEARARELFEQALDLEVAEERREFLQHACGSDAELLLRVEALLMAHFEAGAFLPVNPELATPIPCSEPAPSFSAEQPGESIGLYKLVEKIGEGGMGVVYLAQQEQPVRRRVAVKIIKLGMDTRQVVARFEAERQALALMDHPSIAKVFDGGVVGARGEGLETRGEKMGTFPAPNPSPLASASGRPYFAMEFVNGVPITDFCRQHASSTHERLKLFIQVCSAVQHAHQKGIIHRDLKPSNVLVALQEGVPLPKVIDFGVAKAINQKLTDKTLFTQHLVMIGTPAYMSPEQADLASLDVDTRSDIYSLGVLLYELLTGSPPFPEERLRRVSQSEMQRIIAQEEPERPSTRLTKLHSDSPSSLAPRLSPLATDLDWIVMKCLEKDRNRRYETANGLAADLQRFLGNEPVAARPPSTGYRIRKAIRRNRAAFAAAGVAALTLCLGVAVSVWQAVRADRERARAQRQLQATLRFINDVFTDVSPNVNGLIGGAASSRVLAISGLRLLEDLSRDAKGQGELPIALGLLYLRLSFVHGWLMGNTTGNYAEGLRCADQAIRLLTAADSDVRDDERIDYLARAEMSAGFAAWGLLDYPVATAHFHQMEMWANRLAQSHEPNYIAQGQLLKDWATACVGDVQIAIDPKNLASTFTNFYSLSLTELRKKKAAGSLTNQDEVLSWIGGNDSVGSAYAGMGQYSNGLPYLREGLQGAEEAAQVRPNAAQQASQVAESRAKLGATLLALQQTDEGRTALNLALQTAEDLVKRDPANVGFAQVRIRILALFAAGEAAGARLASDPLPDRRQRIATAETHLERAQVLLGKLTPESAANFLRPDLQRAVDQVAAAKAKLDAGAASPP